MTVLGMYYSQTVEYLCDFGCSVRPPNITFNSTDIPEPVVNLTITCEANGTWSHPPIVCESELSIDIGVVALQKQERLHSTTTLNWTGLVERQAIKT